MIECQSSRFKSDYNSNTLVMRLISFIWCNIFVIFGNVDGDNNNNFKVVQTSDGAVRGIKNTTKWQNIDYYAFKGIPYAEPPTGELRFKAPKPNKPWAPTQLDATKFGNICPQLGQLFASTYKQSEDCLFLNIYVPADVKKNELLPVLFFIHGGGYAEGSGNDNYYEPDFIIEKCVILITFNYRLGVLGLMSLNMPEYSGNMQLKDQQLALKWIHKNIKHFNGDNQLITIIGQSSGAICANFHVLSSESRKYFQNVIQMSGVASQYWAMSDYNDHLDIAHKIANSTGNDTINTIQLVKYLKSESVDYLIKFGSIWALMTDRTFLLPFTPVIERPDAVDPFMIKTIDELYKTEDINVNALITYTTAEMLIVIIKALPKMFDIEGLNSNFTLTLPFKNLNLTTDSKPYRKANADIRQFYFGNEEINRNKSAKYVDMLSDINMCYAIDKAVKLHATKSKGKTYYARFGVSSKLNVFKRNGAQVYSPGACHCDDMCYLFRVGIGETYYDDVFGNKTDRESKISLQTIDHMTNLFINFAKMYSNTNLGFQPIQNGQVNFLDITNIGMVPGISPNAKAMAFWSKIEQEMQPYIKK